MNTLEVLNNNLKMESREVVDLINKFREEEGNRKQLLHKTFLASIDKEIESLENVGISTKQNFVLSSYSDGTRSYRCYLLSKSGIMQMMNKESAVVRYKTQQYIEELEKRLSEHKYSYQIEDPIERAQVWIEEEKERRRLKEVITSSQRIEESRQVINRIVRTIATSKRYRNKYSIAWTDFYSILNYKLGINIKKRKHDKFMLDSLTETELKQAEVVAKCWAEELHIDLNLELSDYKNLTQ